MNIRNKITYFIDLEKQKPRYVFYLVFCYFVLIILSLLFLPFSPAIIHILFLPVIYMAVVSNLKYALLTNLVFLSLMYLYEGINRGTGWEGVNIELLLGGTLLSMASVFLINFFKKQYIAKQNQLSNSMSELAESYKNLEMTQSKLMALTWITRELLEINQDEEQLISSLIELLNKYLLYKKIAYIEISDNGYKIRKKIGFKEIEGEKLLSRLDLNTDNTGRVIIRDIESILTGHRAILVPLKKGNEQHGQLLILHKSDWIEEEDRFVLDILRDHLNLLFTNIKLLHDAHKLAITDGSTNLHNQRYFHQKLREIYNRSLEQNTPFSVIIFDVDNFKDINDQYGHLAGDQVLEELAGILSQNVRNNDVLARYGGDEFIIILPDTDTETGIRISQRIVNSVSEKDIKVENDQIVKTSLSGGIASYPEFAVQEPIDLVQKADEALYHSKQHGKNMVVSSIQLRANT